MNTSKAKAYLKNEIYGINCAIKYRTVSDSTIAEFEDLKDIYNTCLDAFHQLEQITHYHDRLQDWDRGMTEKLEAAVAGQETLQKEILRWQEMYKAAAAERDANMKRVIELERMVGV